MKRSEINGLLREAAGFFQMHSFHLPPFAFWKLPDWRSAGEASRRLVRLGLGWDVTDFGSGKFAETGLLLFTLRNGLPENLERRQGKLYAEKIMMVRIGQVTPLHFHWIKMEDIINRGGGRLMTRLYPSTQDETLGQSPIQIEVNGMVRTLQAGEVLSLSPGESVSIPAGVYHTFWAEEHAVMVGEVSLVNDDQRDNRFLDPIGRFPEVEEDVQPLHLLVSDYSNFLAG